MEREMIWDNKLRAFFPKKKFNQFQKFTALLLVFMFTTMGAATLLDLTSQVKGILPGANGGTNNGFFQVSGPTTSAKTFTFPDASSTVLTSNAAVTVPQGGTGVATLTAHGVVIGEGSGNVAVTSAGSSTQCFTSNGASADPTFQACPGTALNFSFNETPSGALTGTSFTLAHTPNPTGSLMLFKNNALMLPGGADYTLSGTTITTVTAPGTGNPLTAVQYTF
jgi:hypothetical protein